MQSDMLIAVEKSEARQEVGVLVVTWKLPILFHVFHMGFHTKFF